MAADAAVVAAVSVPELLTVDAKAGTPAVAPIVSTSAHTVPFINNLVFFFILATSNTLSILFLIRSLLSLITV